MAKNLRHELRTEIMMSFREGTDKRALKKEGSEIERVFSYGSRNQYLDRANDFCKWVKENCPHIKSADQITGRVVSDYLDSKASCTQKTVDSYRSDMVKIGKLFGYDWRCDRVIADRKADQTRGAQSVIKKEDYEALIQYAKDHPSRSGLCIQLEREIGVRVSDLVYGVEVQSDRLKITCKGGKVCYREVTPQIRELISTDLWSECMIGKHFRPVKDGTINTYLRRTEEKLGLEKHSFHDLRRYGAQEKYNFFRSSGLSRSEALSRVSLWLNHGERRDTMMLRSYIADAW